MTKVICLVGLPGSGKSAVANNLCLLYTRLDLSARFTPSKVIIVDDIKSLDELPSPEECELLIITDPYFCITSTRNMADTFLRLRYGSVEWRFFPNDPEKCRRNVAYRNDGRKVDDFITQLSKVYDPDIIYYKIWQQKEN